MKPLPQKYDHKETEKRWQVHWLASGTYHWDETAPRAESYVIDTPPPTVSGLLHMGHVFSYTQADFVARWQRMHGKTVFYPMGFDDNGLPTERLVEKVTKKRAVDYPSREAFIEACESIAEEARGDFRDLFQSIALSVDWRQEYHTISEDSRKIAQLSFLDLYRKGHVERRLEPMLWDPVDQTAIAQAEVEDKELPSQFCDIIFRVQGAESGEQESSSAPSTPHPAPEHITIATTRPELIPACVAVFYHPDDTRYQHLKGKFAVTPLFGVKVPILEDDTVEMEKGTGIMMCCTFGDEKDIEKWRRHKLPSRTLINKYGKLEVFIPSHEERVIFEHPTNTDKETLLDTEATIEKANCIDLSACIKNFRKILGKKVSNKDPKHLGARETIIEMLAESGDLIEAKPITHAVKCAERSGAPLEILPTPQWFVKVIDKKEALKARSAECDWHPDWMAKRMEQWIDGLSWDWCVSRQRYYGVPFPIWYSKRAGEEGKVIIAAPDQLPCNPLVDTPKGYSRDEVEPDVDVMDTWFTSSVSPQLNSRGIATDPLPPCGGVQEREARLGGGTKNQGNTPHDSTAASGLASSAPPQGGSYLLNPARHAALFPADLRPQAHEIIRTWAFYTLVKAHLHADTIPWKNLMISGWCLAEDKQKMSKSKGNVVTPIDLIEENGADVVRYWASTSKLGQDTAFSRDLLKIGKKLVNKLWNATQFAAIHLDKLPPDFSINHQPSTINQTLDKWIITRLHRTVAKATEDFAAYEYASALRAIEDFFWNDFCDNYLELVKKRVYGETSPTGRGDTEQLSAVYTIYHCLDGILRLFAPILPHVTEELWSHIFEEKYAATGSIHARGNWPKAADYPLDEAAEAEGITVVELLEAIRKAKSEKGVSIKWPITEATVSAELSPSAQADLCGAGNIGTLSHGTGDLQTESGNYSLSLTFAKESDAA